MVPAVAADPQIPVRSRAVLAGGLAGIVALGLLSRRSPPPGIFAEHTGDALYAAAACWAFALLRPRAGAPTAALAGFGFAALVEVSQLLKWPWLLELRRTSVGALVLGQGFQWQDMIAYAAGASLALGALALIARRRRQT